LLEDVSNPDSVKLYTLTMRADSTKYIIDPCLSHPTLSIQTFNELNSLYIFTFPDENSYELFTTFMPPGLNQKNSKIIRTVAPSNKGHACINV